MLESCRLEQSSSAAAPVLGCRVLCHSGEPFPRMSPSLLNAGLALTEGSISSSPHETGSAAWGRLCCWTMTQALFLILHSCMKALRTPQLLPASHPLSVLNSHSIAGQHQGWTTPTHPAPALLHEDFLLSSPQSAFFATGTSKADFRKIPEMANCIWKNQGSFYKLMIVNAGAGEHQLPPWCHQPRNESGHPATDKRQYHELTFPT